MIKSTITLATILLNLSNPNIDQSKQFDQKFFDQIDRSLATKFILHTIKIDYLVGLPGPIAMDIIENMIEIAIDDQEMTNDIFPNNPNNQIEPIANWLPELPDQIIFGCFTELIENYQIKLFEQLSDQIK